MIQLSLNVLLVMDCVTARCGSQVQPTKMTLARQRVLSSSEVRASDLEHGGSWVRIPSGAQIFSVSSYGLFFSSPFTSFIVLISVFIYRLNNRRLKIHPWRRPFEYEIDFCFLDSDGPVKLL